MGTVFIVGLGGALGAMGRYLLSLLPVKTAFPLATLITNILGAVLIGLVVGFADRKGAAGNWLLFWKAGVCGGFTTFSTFSLEALRLFQSGKYGYGGAYIALSLILCIAGVAFGQYAAMRLCKI